MIQANELRIGNIVGRKYFNPNPKNSKQEIQICFIVGLLDLVRVSLDLKGRDVLKCDYDSLEPIPLTPEILERCGAEKFPSGDKSYTLHGILISYADCRNVFTHDGKELKYLHKLQNYIYESTSQELNYQP